MTGLGQLVDEVSQRRPLHAPFIQGAHALLSAWETAEADLYLTHLLKNRTLQYIAESYETILDDTLDAQMFFMKEGRYKNQSFAEVADAVYFDDQYMQRYMVGLAVTCYLWPNHVQMARFFRETFPWTRSGSYLEVGPGHGLFLLQAMRESKLDKFMGVDISPSSLALTEDVVRSLLPAAMPKLSLVQADFLAPSQLAGGHDVLVMGEVLEHVEQPQKFLERLRGLAAPGAHLFVTTCINAPAIDHIYLFNTTDEVEDMIRAAGLKIVRALHVPYFGKTLQQSVKQKLPINVAYVLAP